MLTSITPVCHAVFDFFSLKCSRCVNNIESRPPPEDADTASDLSLWHHCRDRKRLPDNALKAVYECGKISFVFYQKSHEAQLSTAIAKAETKQTEENEEEEIEDDSKDDSDDVDWNKDMD